MQNNVNIPGTRKQIKSDARAMLSRHDLLLKLIFGGFLYIAVLILLEIFSEYIFNAIFYNLEENELQKYSTIFSVICILPSFLLSSPLFMGLKRLSAKLSNGNSADFAEIFIYYGSWKSISKAWRAMALIGLPLSFISAVKQILPLISSEESFVTLTLPLANLILTISYFILALLLCGRFFPFVNSVVCGGDQPVSHCLKASLKATKNKTWKLFAFHLSFIPWILLSFLTVGTLFVIFTFPYMLVAECLYSSYLLSGEYRNHITEETL